MSDSQEKSDDLIAELAKLMASNAQSGEPEAKPALKMTPLSQAATAPGPIRIPGMAQPSAPTTPAPAAAPAPAASAAPAESKPAVSPIRIPGMSQAAPQPQVDRPAPSAPTGSSPASASPASSSPAGPAQTAPTQSGPAQSGPAPVKSAGSQFDFGKPPGVAPVSTEPMSNWQSREAPKPAPQPQNEPLLSVPLKSAPVEPRATDEHSADSSSAQPQTRPEPAPAAPAERPVAPVHAPIPTPAAHSTMPNNAPAGDSFDFDFGFGSDAEQAERHEPEQSQPSPQPRPEAPAHDPIADLITAELDGDESSDTVEYEDVKPEEPAKPAAPTPAVAPPIRTYSSPQQAPVLVAKPAGTRPAAAPAATPAPGATPRKEGERFAVAPVFGLGSKPAAPQPAARREPDPMDEIESLIGEAVRVELTPSEKAPTVTPAAPPPQSKATPVVPPLNTAFAPRRTQIKDREPQVQSAEDAIMAAAAATGANVDHLEAEDRRPVKRMKVKPPKSRRASSGSRQLIGLAVAGTLLLAAGLGLYWVLGMGRSDPGSAPVLTADGESAKQPAPVTTTAETAEPASSGLFDQLQGTVDPDPAETLVSRDETAGATPTEVTRVVGEVAPEDTEGGLANRKVRTVTVRPDGTIVPGDEAVAGNEVLPVDRPTVPDLPGGDAEPSALLADTQTASIEPDAIAAAITGETPVTAEVDPNVSALVANTPRTVDPTITAPVPMPRPTDRSAMVGGGNQPVELTPLAAAPQVQTSSSSDGNAAAYVQLSSQRSEGDAQAALRNAQSRYGSLMQGNSLEIQRADLGQKGIYYRVRLPASSLQEATSICASIKANGGDCFATGS